jgi:hypothetical protein
MSIACCRLCGLLLLGLIVSSPVVAKEPARVAQTPPLLRAPMNNDVVVPPAIIVPEQSAPQGEVLQLPPPLLTPPPGDEQYQPPQAAPPVYRVPQPNVVPPIGAPQYQPAPPAITYLPSEVPTEATGRTSSGKLLPIAYRHWGRKVIKDCEPLMPQTLCVAHPCTDCDVLVPVCLPACCLNCEPKVHARKAVFSDSLVSFEWDKGIKIVVRFERNGKLIVTYHGI